MTLSPEIRNPRPAIQARPKKPRSPGGVVLAVERGSLAANLDLRPGDVILAVNRHPVEDVIDVQFYAADDEVEMVYRREGRRKSARGPRLASQPLGLDFAHPTFDIPIRRCKNLCPFCFVLQMAPHLRRTLYVKDDDFRYSFLNGNYVTLTNLSRSDWKRIEQQHLSPLYISVHATDLKTRRLCLGNPKAPGILKQLQWLAERGIEMHTQVVVTPGLNDGGRLEKSVSDLAAFYPAVQSVSVVPVGLTKHHKFGLRLNKVVEVERVLEAITVWQAEFVRRFGVRFVYPTDEWFLLAGRPVPPRKYYDGLELEENGLGRVRAFLDDWRRVKKALANGEWRTTPKRAARHPKTRLRGGLATLATGQLFEGTLRQTTDELNRLTGARLNVVGVVNDRLGSSVTVAGLLMGRDVMTQLAGRDLGEFVVLPRVMFEHPCGLSLDDLSPLDIARRLKRPVFLASYMGEVLDAFAGRNLLRFDPDHDMIPPEVMQAGGWVALDVLPPL